MRDKSDSGFTLVEVLAVSLIGAMLLGLGAGALRHYVRAKALNSARETAVTQLRSVQQRTFTEGYPRAYGVRFPKNGARWDVVRYDASTGACTVVESHELSNGVRVAGAGTDFPESAAATACRSVAPNASTDHEVVLFFARGTATAGTVTFSLDGSTKTRQVQVNGATGRVS
jgi:prepilin-type N-terminal cleavage/methylation domain-containing protein